MIDQNCAYCMKNELLDAFGIKICNLSTSKLYLFKEQSHKGRVIVAHNSHVSEMVALSDEERNAFFADINLAANALHKAFSPNKINYGAYGDTGCHLHFHLVPKYEGEFEWASTFEMNPGQTYLSDEENAAIIAAIKQYL
ncbi:MAG: HIT family protein [Lachnospiraceae bacterium]